MSVPNEVTDSLDWLAIFFIHEIYDDAVLYKEAYNEIKKEIAEAYTDDLKVKVVVIEEKLIDLKNKTLQYEYFFSELTSAGLNPFKFDVTGSAPKNWQEGLRYFLTKIKVKNRLLLTWSHGSAFGINTEKFPIKFENNHIKADLNYIKANGDPFFTSVESTKNIFEIKNSFEVVENDTYKVYVTPDPGDKALKKNLFTESVNVTEHFSSNRISIPEDNNFLSGSELQHFKKFSLGTNCKDLQILWLWQIAVELEECSKIIQSQKPIIDILVMTNCFTNLVDNWLLFKNVVNYYIAPETSMDVNGYDYLNLLKSLNKKPADSNESIAVTIIDDFVKKNKSDPSELTREILEKTAIYCTDLSLTEKAMIPFTEICNIILNEEKKMTKAIFSSLLNDLKYIRKFDLNAISETHAGTAIDIVDLSTLLDCFAERLRFAIKDGKTSGKLKIHSVEFSKAIVPMIRNKHVGKIISDSDVKFRKKFSPTGGAVFFPEETLSNPPVSNFIGFCAMENNTPFTNHILWDDLLKKIVP